MDRAFKIGCRVVYFDSVRKPHEALVTNWFHGGPNGQTVEEYIQKQKDQGSNEIWIPCCNLLWVSDDSNKSDPYGRQIERQTSTSYGRQQGMVPFVGNCWCWPDEVEEAKELAAKSYEAAKPTS